MVMTKYVINRECRCGREIDTEITFGDSVSHEEQIGVIRNIKCDICKEIRRELWLAQLRLALET